MVLIELNTSNSQPSASHDPFTKKPQHQQDQQTPGRLGSGGVVQMTRNRYFEITGSRISVPHTRMALHLPPREPKTITTSNNNDISRRNKHRITTIQPKCRYHQNQLYHRHAHLNTNTKLQVTIWAGPYPILSITSEMLRFRSSGMV